jgi:dTDP-4-dehydrorhamnose reductase
MKILLTGASGQLGRELLPRLGPFGPITGIDRQSGARDERILREDLSDFDRLESFLHRVQPDLIVNAAAYTAVDRAENESAQAFRINAELPGCLARWSERTGCLLLHYSTDYVFSGEASSPYPEDSPTGPLNVYGASKLAGEQAITGSGCRYLILRTSWVYSSHGSNFVLTMLRLARERPSINVVADQLGCPTWAHNLAAVSADLVAKACHAPDRAEHRGIWHYCDSGVVSWYDFARMIFEMGVDVGLLARSPEVTAVPSSAVPQEATRPRYSVLDTSAIRASFSVVPVGLAESLRSCLVEVKRNDA